MKNVVVYKMDNQIDGLAVVLLLGIHFYDSSIIGINLVEFAFGWAVAAFIVIPVLSKIK